MCLSISVGINRFIDFYTATSRQTIFSPAAMATDDIVIKELLWFYINRMDVLPRSILNRIILDNFKDGDILSAKDTLHSYVSTTLKHVGLNDKGPIKANTTLTTFRKSWTKLTLTQYRSMSLVILANYRPLILIMSTSVHCHVKLPRAKANYMTLNYLIKLLSIQCLNFLRKSPLLYHHCYLYFLH